MDSNTVFYNKMKITNSGCPACGCLLQIRLGITSRVPYHTSSFQQTHFVPVAPIGISASSNCLRFADENLPTTDQSDHCKCDDIIPA